MNIIKDRKKYNKKLFFCVMPFISIAVEASGAIRLCCGTKKYFHFIVQNDDMSKRLVGRVYKDGSSYEMITEDDHKDLIGKTILLRSPLYCKAKDGVCETCFNPRYVEELGVVPKDKLGLKVVGSIAGTLTDLTLKASHTGLSLNQEEVDIRKDIKQYTS